MGLGESMDDTGMRDGADRSPVPLELRAGVMLGACIRRRLG